LFLDIWVPGKAIRGEVKNLPVLFWLYGGGYVLGAKSFSLYDGSPLLKSAGNNMIFIAPNYRASNLVLPKDIWSAYTKTPTSSALSAGLMALPSLATVLQTSVSTTNAQPSNG